MMTVSAVSRLIPRPPALVERRKAKSGDPGALKCSIDFFLTSEGTVPARAKENNEVSERFASSKHEERNNEPSSLW